MINPFDTGDKETAYNHIPLASDMENIVKPYQKIWKTPQDTAAMINVQPTDPLSLLLLELNKKPFEEIQRAKEKEAFWGIGRYLDDALKEKAEKDENLRIILVSAIPQIFTYLNKSGKRYRLRAQLWRDIEVEDWEEHVINIEIEYKTHEEKMKIWKELCDTVYEIDPNVTFLIEIEKLK